MVEFNHVSSHVGIVDNKKKDNPTKKTLGRVHKNTPRTHQDLLELDRIVDGIVVVCCNTDICVLRKRV